MDDKFEKALSLYFTRRVFKTNVLHEDGSVEIQSDIIWVSTQTGKGVAGRTHDGWTWSFFGEAIHR